MQSLERGQPVGVDLAQGTDDVVLPRGKQLELRLRGGVSEMLRKLPNRVQPVSQLVYSDGLATMSVFVEPMPQPARTAEATNEDGALSVFVRPMGEHLVTVLGEVPPAAVQQVGRSIVKQQQTAAAGPGGGK